MEESSDNSNTPMLYTCPQCNQEAEVTPEAVAQLISCPHCGMEFIVAGKDGSTALPDENTEERQDDWDGELDGLKIKNLAKERRAMIRTRSYILVLALGCLVGIGQMIWSIIHHARLHDWHALQYTGYASGIISLAIAANYLLRRAHAMQRQINQSALGEPTTPPDFSALSDGSQQWRNLEKYADEEKSDQNSKDETGNLNE